MSTVTPVSSNDAQRLQQEIMSEASRAFQILLETLKEEWNKSIDKEKIDQEPTKQKSTKNQQNKNQPRKLLKIRLKLLLEDKIKMPIN